MNFIIIGGAGFIGSYIAEWLAESKKAKKITIYDNFSSGKEWHLKKISSSSISVIKADIYDRNALDEGMKGQDVVVHLASNPDIAKAVTDPEIDFRQGTMLTNNVLESMRINKVKYIIYASGSGVYGDKGEFEFKEDYGPKMPTSTYGASKLAGETLISSYCYMFGMAGYIFRFGNVVGGRQTHGVGYDFLRKLRKTPSSLDILGNGLQSKSYVHISDVIRGIFAAFDKSKNTYQEFNIATGDYITVKEIADLVVSQLGLEGRVQFLFTGGDRGWKGDVPIIRLNTDRIRAFGWENLFSSKEAIQKSLREMVDNENIFS
jgi:UDP-glucose 4-epimerase